MDRDVLVYVDQHGEPIHVGLSLVMYAWGAVPCRPSVCNRPLPFLAAYGLLLGGRCWAEEDFDRRPAWLGLQHLEAQHGAVGADSPPRLRP